jgi:hypothetical protein
MRALVLSLILCSSLVGTARGQNRLPDTPTDDEIILMLSQLQRAMNQYEVLVTQEDELLAGVREADTTTDKRLITCGRRWTKDFEIALRNSIRRVVSTC